MELGVHLVNFAFQAGRPRSRRAGPRRGGRRAGGGHEPVRNGSLPADRRHGRRRRSAPMLEGYTTLGYLAAHTKTVELQLLVTGVTYRHPGLLGKIVSTLDVLSGGRAALGIGAAWYEREHAAYGVRFPPLKERFERLEETLQIVHQMWGPTTGRSRHPLPARQNHQLTPAAAQAAPTDHDRWRWGEEDLASRCAVRRRLQPLRRAADLASPVAAKLDILASHCEHEGTDVNASARASYGPARSTPPTKAARARRAAGRYLAVGITEVHVMPMGGDPADFVDAMGRYLVPRLTDLG